MSYRKTHKRVLHDCTYSIVHIVLFNIYDRSARAMFTAEHCKHPKHRVRILYSYILYTATLDSYIQAQSACTVRVGCINIHV